MGTINAKKHKNKPICKYTLMPILISCCDLVISTGELQSSLKRRNLLKNRFPFVALCFRFVSQLRSTSLEMTLLQNTVIILNWHNRHLTLTE